MRYSAEAIVLNSGSATSTGSVTGAGTGEWINVSDYLEKCIDVRVTGSVSAEVRVSNEPNLPDNSSDGVLYTPALTATGLVVITAPVKWLKLKPASVGGGSSLSGFFHGNRYVVRF